jgi:hypothetical protein
MGLLYYVLKRHPSLRSHEARVKIILDLMFYALFFLLIWQSRPIYVDYCSTNPSMNVSSLKNMTLFNESLLDNISQNSSFIINESRLMGNMNP